MYFLCGLYNPVKPKNENHSDLKITSRQFLSYSKRRLMRRRQAGNFHVAINIPEELLVLLLLHYIYIEHVKARNLHILLFQGILVSLIKCGKLEIFLIYESFPKCHFKDISIPI